jgi:hypothetical protein
VVRIDSTSKKSITFRRDHTKIVVLRLSTEDRRHDLALTYRLLWEPLYQLNNNNNDTNYYYNMMITMILRK